MYFDGTVHIEREDQCYTCEHFLKGLTCPLLEALALGIVELDGDIVVQNCGFYKEFKRTLWLVEPEEEEEEEDDDEADEESEA